MALNGLKVIEMAGLAPAPFCGMILADFGAKVTRIDRAPSKGKKFIYNADTLARGKRSVSINLKSEEGVEVARKLCTDADVLIEPFRKGVMEKLGLGPDRLFQDNPKLIYARLTGFGQTGPLSHKAGHDINYIATSGVLAQLGRKHEKPYPPINLVADFAGGGLMCALGILMALNERHRSGQGQVVDANMVNGSAYVSTFLWTSRAMPIWPGSRGENILDGGAGFYDTYKTKDNKYMSVGALEPQFYADLLKGLGIKKEDLPQSTDPTVMSQKFSEVFSTKTRDEWTEIFKDLDACCFPILEMDEAQAHPHNKETEIFLKGPNGDAEPAPAPKLSRTGAVRQLLPMPAVGEHTINELLDAGFSKARVDKLIEDGTVFQCKETSSKI